MKSSKTREAPKVATYAERRQMEDLILLNSAPVAEANGMDRAWKEGWNFERVAKSAGARFKASHARRVAKALGVTVAAEVPPTDGFRRAFAALEARVTTLEALMGVGLQRIFASAPPPVEPPDVRVAEEAEVRREAELADMEEELSN